MREIRARVHIAFLLVSIAWEKAQCWYHRRRLVGTQKIVDELRADLVRNGGARLLLEHDSKCAECGEREEAA